MDSKSLKFRMVNYIPIGNSGRVKLRWDDCMEDDFKFLRMTNIELTLSGNRDGKGLLRNTVSPPRAFLSIEKESSEMEYP
ncbi:hypothetical protein TNCV_4300551 [Trichonephila clavipes]|nr:hypothetical protein TNCV_4300551 [Trichonephila clavipes]